MYSDLNCAQIFKSLSVGLDPNRIRLLYARVRHKIWKVKERIQVKNLLNLCQQISKSKICMSFVFACKIRCPLTKAVHTGGRLLDSYFIECGNTSQHKRFVVDYKSNSKYHDKSVIRKIFAEIRCSFYIRVITTCYAQSQKANTQLFWYISLLRWHGLTEHGLKILAKTSLSTGPTTFSHRMDENQNHVLSQIRELVDTNQGLHWLDNYCKFYR